jgi:EAL domain-containing protein (putative c-di-GMP-specific phosphodiesterase class I)
MRLGSDRLYVAVSAGVARQREGDDAETMLRHADAAMYRAKNAVARRWAEYTEPMHDASVNQLRRDGELVEAISGGQLFCEFQPIVDARTGEMLAHEALVRWHHPALGRIEPGGFVSASERTGLIVPLSAWVLDESLRRSAEWPENVAVSVNLSARQFADPSLADRVLAALERAGAAPSRLIVEVTETAVMSEPDIAAQCLRSLHSAGVRIAFDDFGTGYTSITDVQRLPIDLLKMDRGFVSATRTEQGRDLLGALYSLASALGVATIAEGVETPEELRLVQDLGGTYVQGYLLGRPVPAESVAHHHIGVGTFGDGRAVTPERAS